MNPVLLLNTFEKDCDKIGLKVFYDMLYEIHFKRLHLKLYKDNSSKNTDLILIIF